jgi:hypothetical protein
VERHNQTVNLFKEETPGAVQTAVVTCTEIIDSSMLVEEAAAGMVSKTTWLFTPVYNICLF